MSKRQKTISEFGSKSDSRIFLSKPNKYLILAVAEGESLHQVLNSALTKMAFEQNNWVLPSQNTLRQIILDFSTQLKNVIKDDFKELKQAVKFFSIAIDEWTSISGKSFMNIYLTHADDSFNLGLQELTGSLTADNLINFMQLKLDEFGLKLKEIVGITCDGASVMLSLQSKVNCITQICLAHGIHLSVKDTLVSQEKSLLLNNDDSDLEEDNSRAIENFYDIRYVDCINSMMKIINSFSHSRTLQEKLNFYRTSEGLKTKRFVKHSKIRWNSLYLSIDSFLELFPQVNKVYIDTKSTGSSVIKFIL